MLFTICAWRSAIDPITPPVATSFDPAQAGQIMQAAAMLNDIPQPSDADIDGVMSGNLCRCMAYVRIRSAIKIAAVEMHGVVPPAAAASAATAPAAPAFTPEIAKHA